MGIKEKKITQYPLSEKCTKEIPVLNCPLSPHTVQQLPCAVGRSPPLLSVEVHKAQFSN